MHSRRRFLLSSTSLAAATLALPTLATSAATSSGALEKNHNEQALRVGMAGYTLREFSVDEALSWMAHWGVRYWAVRRDHLPLTATALEASALREKAAAAGVEIYTAGVITLNKEDEIMPAFSYAQRLGVKMIVAAPALDLLPAVEKAVQETDIRVAIHNHGPDVYKEVRASFDTPDRVYAAIAGLDRRIGLCIDIGHTQRCGVDPTESFVRCADRVLDFHLKDVTLPTKAGVAVALGRGMIDIPKFLQAVRKSGFQGVASLELETARVETLTGISESIGYLQGFQARGA